MEAENDVHMGRCSGNDRTPLPCGASELGAPNPTGSGGRCRFLRWDQRHNVCVHTAITRSGPAAAEPFGSQKGLKYISPIFIGVEMPLKKPCLMLRMKRIRNCISNPSRSGRNSPLCNPARGGRMEMSAAPSDGFNRRVAPCG